MKYKFIKLEAGETSFSVAKEEGTVQFILEVDGWLRMLQEKNYPELIGDNKAFSTILEELVRLANLAEGEPDPARDAITRFKESFKAMLLLAEPASKQLEAEQPTTEQATVAAGLTESEDDIPF